MWNLPGAGIKPVFPELAGGVFTTESSEKPLSLLLAYMISILLCITVTVFYSMSLNLSFLVLPRAWIQGLDLGRNRSGTCSHGGTMLCSLCH